MDLKSIFKPGCIDPRVRVFYFFIFLLITVIQIWLALQMEEDSGESRYPQKKPIL